MAKNHYGYNLIDRSTGEIIRARTRSPYVIHVHARDNYYRHVHSHSHTYKPSGFTVGSRIFNLVRRTGGTVRRNFGAIFAIFVVLLIYIGFVAKVVNPDNANTLTFTGFLKFFSTAGNDIDGSYFVEHYRQVQSAWQSLGKLSEFRFDGVLAIFNPLLTLFSSTIKSWSYIGTIVGFLLECVWYLIEFLFLIFSFIFGGLFI